MDPLTTSQSGFLICLFDCLTCNIGEIMAEHSVFADSISRVQTTMDDKWLVIPGYRVGVGVTVSTVFVHTFSLIPSSITV